MSLSESVRGIRVEPVSIVNAAATTDPAITIPSSQTTFTSIVESHRSRYESANNELQKSALRTSRKEALRSALPRLSISGWIGTIDGMGTTSDGNAAVTIKLQNSAIRLETRKGCGPNKDPSTLIGHRTAVYNVFADSSVGDTVSFGGTFDAGGRDYILECSYSESGSMTQPEFFFRITDVRKVDRANAKALEEANTKHEEAEASYAEAIQDRVVRNWVSPSIGKFRCEITVKQSRSGVLVSYEFGPCVDDVGIKKSIIDAVERSSPFPPPDDPTIWDEELRFHFEH
jgi:hypothetical protein